MTLTRWSRTFLATVVPLLTVICALETTPKRASILDGFGRDVASFSTVTFGQPGFWRTYRWPIAGVVVFCLLQAALIVALLVYHRKRVQAEAEAALIADISSKYVNLPVTEVDREIIDAQRRICELLGLDLAALWQWSGDAEGSFTLSHFYCAVERLNPPEGMKAHENFPWFLKQMLAGRIMAISSVDDLPPEADRDLEVLRQFGINACLVIPLAVGGEAPVGAVTFNSMGVKRDWPPSLIRRLELVAQIFANALARKRADQVLRESEMRLSLAVDSAEAGLWVLDVRTRVFWVTNRIREIFGISPDEVLNMERFQTLVHPDDWSIVEEGIGRSLDRGESVNLEYRIMVAGGQERWIASSGRPQRGSTGEVDRLLGLSMDITKRKRVEAEVLRKRAELAHVTRVAAMGQLASSLAHELSQPLGAILRNAEAAELFLQDPSPELEEVRAILEDIRRDGRRAGEVIDRVRALMKQQHVEHGTWDLEHLAEEVLALLRPDAQRRGVKLTMESGSPLPSIRGDRVQLQQVLLNLLINAMDAVNENPPADRLVALRVQRMGDGVGLSVCDNGRGIAEDDLTRVFEPFFTSKPNGLGMGLPISRDIIEAHGGRLWACNEADGGAKFTFVLPASGEGTGR